jgi:hypothetical protein
MGGLKPPSQRRASWQRAECDMVINILMRFYEFFIIKPKKPLTPAQARITALKRQVDMARQSLKRERDFQRQQKIIQQQQKLTKQKI